MDNCRKHFYCAAEKGKDVAKISPKFKRVHESFLWPKLFSAKIKRFFCDLSDFMEPETAATKNENKENKNVDEF